MRRLVICPERRQQQLHLAATHHRCRRRFLTPSLVRTQARCTLVVLLPNSALFGLSKAQSTRTAFATLQISTLQISSQGRAPLPCASAAEGDFQPHVVSADSIPRPGDGVSDGTDIDAAVKSWKAKCDTALFDYRVDNVKENIIFYRRRRRNVAQVCI